MGRLSVNTSIVAVEKTVTDFFEGSLMLRKVMDSSFQASWCPLLSVAEHCAQHRLPSEQTDELLDKVFAAPSYGSVYQGPDHLDRAMIADVSMAEREAAVEKDARPESLIAKFEVRQVDHGHMQFAFCLWTEMSFGWTVLKDKAYDYGSGPEAWTFWIEAWPGRHIGAASPMFKRAKEHTFMPLYVPSSGRSMPRRFPDVGALEQQLHKKYLEEQVNMRHAIEAEQARKATEATPVPKVES